MKKVLVALFCLISVYSSGKIGFGGGIDLCPNAARLSIRNWFNKIHGIELGFGPTASLEDFRFNDQSIQGKYFVGLRYNRYFRTYVGALARYTFVNDPFFHKNMPSGGAFAGNEWYLGRYRNQGVAIEGGIMYGRVTEKSYVQGTNVTIDKHYKEFPLYVSFSYKIYLR